MGKPHESSQEGPIGQVGLGWGVSLAASSHDSRNEGKLWPGNAVIGHIRRALGVNLRPGAEGIHKSLETLCNKHRGERFRMEVL